MRMLLLLSWLLVCRCVMADTQPLRFASAEWPPYVSASLLEQGMKEVDVPGAIGRALQPP